MAASAALISLSAAGSNSTRKPPPVRATIERSDSRTHELLSAASRNPVLRAIWKQLNARMHALRFRSNQDETKWAQALQEHAHILKALQARDGPTLRDLLVQHLRRKRDAVLERPAST